MGSLARWTRASCIVVLVDFAIVGVSADGDPPTRSHRAVTGTAGSDEVQQSRVRILSPRMAPDFGEGIRRSSTLRSLVDAIDASNGIVYVEHGVCKRAAHACLMGSVVVAGPSRILRVRIHETRVADDLIASLGHELQHAVEVLADPAVTTAAGFRWLFQKIGVRSGEMFETFDAIRVAHAIRRELAASARREGDTRLP